MRDFSLAEPTTPWQRLQERRRDERRREDRDHDRDEHGLRQRPVLLSDLGEDQTDLSARNHAGADEGPPDAAPRGETGGELAEDADDDQTESEQQSAGGSPTPSDSDTQVDLGSDRNEEDGREDVDDRPHRVWMSLRPIGPGEHETRGERADDRGRAGGLRAERGEQGEGDRGRDENSADARPPDDADENAAERHPDDERDEEKAEGEEGRLPGLPHRRPSRSPRSG